MRLLWIGRKSGDEGDGGRIYDRGMIAALSADHQIETLTLSPLGRPAQLAGAALRASAPETFSYGGRAQAALIAARAQAWKPDVIVFSHEHLDRLAADLRSLTGAKAPPFLTLRHNVTSDLMRQVLGGPLGGVYAAAARRQERQALSGPLFAGIVALSLRDQRLLAAITGRRDIGLAMPGAPPPTPLEPYAANSKDAVLLGTYDWFPKRRDLNRFVEAVAADRPAPWEKLLVDSNFSPEHAGILQAQSANSLDFSTAIRFGLITDRFAAGHKLKTSAYLMRNCQVLSFADVSDDFAFAESAGRWIVHVRDIADIREAMLQATNRPMAERQQDLAALKEAIGTKMSWTAQAAGLHETIVRAARAVQH